MTTIEMTETQEKKAKTVADLLAKAESTTPEEAAALQERVAFLMAKYSLDEARIQQAKAAGAQDVVVQEVTHMSGSYAAPEQNLLIGISNSMEIKPLVGGSGSKRYVRMIGFKSDVEQAKILYLSLQIQAGLALKAFTKTGDAYEEWMTGMQKFKVRRDFLYAFAEAATFRIRKGKEAAVTEAKAEDVALGRASEAGTELVLVRKAEQVQSYIDSEFGRLGVRRDRVQRGYGAGYRAGREAGQNANVNGGRQTALPGAKKAVR